MFVKRCLKFCAHVDAKFTKVPERTQAVNAKVTAATSIEATNSCEEGWLSNQVMMDGRILRQSLP